MRTVLTGSLAYEPVRPASISAKNIISADIVEIAQRNQVPAVQTIYSYRNSAAKTLADRYGYYFVAIDSAWMASHGR